MERYESIYSCSKCVNNNYINNNKNEKNIIKNYIECPHCGAISKSINISQKCDYCGL